MQEQLKDITKRRVKMSNVEDLFSKVQNRVYILKWEFMTPSQKIEKRTEYYSWEDRGTCINRYMDLVSKWYASDIQMLVAEPKEVDIESIINQI